MDEDKRDGAERADAICNRVLLLREADGSSSELTVSLDTPRPATRGYYCRVSITGKAMNESFDAHGIDGFQALKQALVGIRSKLDGMPGEISWLNQPGFTGFPRIINDGFGLEFLNKCERLVEAEQAKLNADLAAKRAGQKQD